MDRFVSEGELPGGSFRDQRFGWRRPSCPADPWRRDQGAFGSAAGWGPLRQVESATPCQPVKELAALKQWTNADSGPQHRPTSESSHPALREPRLSRFQMLECPDSKWKGWTICHAIPSG